MWQHVPLIQELTYSSLETLLWFERLAMKVFKYCVPNCGFLPRQWFAGCYGLVSQTGTGQMNGNYEANLQKEQTSEAYTTQTPVLTVEQTLGAWPSRHPVLS